MELFLDVLPCDFVGCGCQCNHGNAWKLLAQHAELGIFRPEIVSPLRDAVSFVDGEKRHIDVFQEEIRLAEETFG